MNAAAMSQVSGEVIISHWFASIPPFYQRSKKAR